MLLHIAINTSFGITSGSHNTYYGHDRASSSHSGRVGCAGHSGHGGHSCHSCRSCHGHCGGRGGRGGCGRGTNANIINRPHSGRISHHVDRGDAMPPSS